MRSRLAWIAVVLAAAGPLGAQSGTITPNENLVIDGVPPLPEAIAGAVGRYADFRWASFESWHPTRRELLITTRFAETSQVHLVRFPGGARRQLTFFKERVAGAMFPRQAGDYFVFAMDKGGNEFTQLYRYDLATGTETLLTDGRSQNSRGVFSRHGDRLAYTSTRRNGADRDLYVMDPRTAGTDRLVCPLTGGGWIVFDWSPDDKQLLVGEYISVSESYLWLVDAATGARTPLTPRTGGGKVAYGRAQFSSDGRAVFATTDRDAEFMRLVRIDLAGRVERCFSADIPWDVEEFRLSPDGKNLALVTNEDGLSVLRVLDAGTGEQRLLPLRTPGVASGLDWHSNNYDLALSLSSSSSPLDVYSLDVRTNDLQRWTESETGGLNAAAFSAPEAVRWESFDGRAISGWLYRPPARFAGKRPVIVSLHGGPESQSRPGFLGRNNYYVNELGAALVLPNVRGSTGYGKTFDQLDNGRLREDAVKDVGALLDWIAREPGLDADRVMVMGGSYGGYLTLAVAAHYSERIRCAVDVVGISNFISFLERTEAYRRDLRRVEYGDERDPQMRAFLEQISPLNAAARMRRPLFIVQGRNDPRVPAGESEQMVATLKRQGTPVWYLMARNEGHGFAKKPNADFQLWATVAFIREYLLK